MQKTIKWSAAQPLKRPDCIISSKARETGDVGFKPSYLSEPKESMRFIMSNEYMRVWYSDRSKYEKDTYSKEQIIKEESKIKRRFVQRMMTYKKPDKNEFLEGKVLKTVKEGNNKEQPVDYKNFKYKPVCLKQKEKLAERALVKDRVSKTDTPLRPKASKANAKKEPQGSENAEDTQNQAIILCPAVPCCPSQ